MIELILSGDCYNKKLLKILRSKNSSKINYYFICWIDNIDINNVVKKINDIYDEPFNLWKDKNSFLFSIHSPYREIPISKLYFDGIIEPIIFGEINEKT